MQNFDTKQITDQFDAGKAYSETSLAQLRNLMNVKDAEGLRDYMEGQQKVAKDMTERLKGDAEKVVSLQQDFVKNSQKLTEENVKQTQKLTEENVKKTQKAAESNAKQATDTDTDAKTAKQA
jgi:phasin family protein